MRTIVLPICLCVSALGFAGAVRAQAQRQPYDPRPAFAEADKNGDGVIDLSEFHDRIVDVFYLTDANKDGFLAVEEYQTLPASGLFTEADTNGDGRLSLHEFERIRVLQYEEADTNHDGVLSLDEVTVAAAGGKKK